MFNTLGLAPTLLEILGKRGFTTPTPIQAKAIPVALEGKDIIGIAQTGTGKTLAFGLPMIERLARFKGKGLVLLPTRELALQVEESLRNIGGPMGLKTVVLIGGASMGLQIRGIKANPHIIIATPGRLNDHLQQKTIRLNEVKILVLDEADRMLDMGFLPQIKQILATVPPERQTMLFSATMPDAIATIAKSSMNNPVRIDVAPQGTLSDRVAQSLYVIGRSDKERLLEAILNEHSGTALVFSRTKHGANKLAKKIRNFGHTADEIHGDRSLSQRKFALEGFKRGQHRVLVATDIAARGIDVKEIGLVINYDLPDNPEDYVHRIGRTGRAGAQGKAVTFATPDQRMEVKQIERLTRNQIPLNKLPTLPERRPDVFSDLPQSPSRAPRSSGRVTGQKSWSARPASSQSPNRHSAFRGR